MSKIELVGSAKVRLDDRGRVAVPKQFRELLRVPSVLTNHPHGCLAVYTEARFAELEAQLGARPNTKYFDSLLEEIVFGGAETLQLDAADRFLIGGHLRTDAGIERDARLFKISDSIRIWSEERWRQRHALMLSRLQDEEFSSTWRDLRL